MPIVIDYVNELILFTSPTVEVDAQTLHDYIQDESASPVGMGQPWIDQADPQDDTEILYPDGKIADPSAPTVFSQIILRFNPRWQMQFWQGSGYTRIYGGKIVGGVGGEVIKATGAAGDITVLESPVDGVTVTTGSGVLPGDVTAISAAVWNKLAADHLAAGSMGKLMDIMQLMLDEMHKIQGLDISNPMVVTPTARTAGTIDLDITGDGETITTVTRQ